MQGSATISKKLPPLKSMQYELLRETGVRYIQKLAGKLWTDYNSHDPGITMLEVLSYVITDLGYRVNNDIRDLLARNIRDRQIIQNFYTAGEIFPNCPVTKNDYRKLMMDVEVVDETKEDCKYAGVKNAWITRSPVAEHEIFVNHGKSKLSLDPIPLVAEQDSYFVNALYDVLLEFDSCDTYGDLNSNTIEEDLVIYEHAPDPGIQGVRFNTKIEFPKWDNPKVNWEDAISIRTNILNITIEILDLPGNYTLNVAVSNKNEVILTGKKEISGTISAIDGLAQIIDQVNGFIYDPADGLLQLYVQKVAKTQEIVNEVLRTLHANRSLCDDYFRFNALKVEEILLCADIQIDPIADVETVEAHICHEISGFLSPQVNFYTLEEMLNKCRNSVQYELTEIKRFKKTFTIKGGLEEDLSKDDIITLLNAGEPDGEYTVACISKNRENPDYTDVQVQEEITTNDYEEGAYLFKGTIDDTLCLTVDKIFEGPKLKHGFIDDDELNQAERVNYIHVSDLIKIIMDVEGVLAVKSIQIANRPLDNTDEIPSKSVRWCLELAMEENYVPRLNCGDSKLTFFKEQLPYHANRMEVDEIIESLKDSDRPQKIRYPKMDIPVPKGEYQDLENYVSLQEEFPSVYGVGSSGIPGLEALNDEERTIRQTEVKQHKGFLLFFDQLMANYLSQLAHVKELFSMNGEKDKFGNYLIDKTYFSHPLYDIIPNADPLYVNKSGHNVKLQEIVENQELYEQRRNKFLDHLLGRFAESFTDYALLSYKISGAKAPEELIEDKLKFLNDYPDLSKSRGKAFNYLDQCRSWHVNNATGLEKRVSLLTGMEQRSADKLAFTGNFTIASDNGQFKGQIEDDSANLLLETPIFDTETAVKETIELLLVNGVLRENFQIFEADGSLAFDLSCDGEVLGTSIKTYTNDIPGNTEAEDDINMLIGVIEREYFTNPEANRKNLTCPLLNYFEYEVNADMTPVDPEPPVYIISYTLYSRSFAFTPENILLEGSITRPAKVGDTEPEVLEKGEEYAHKALWEVINNGAGRGQYAFDPSMAPYSPYHFVIHDRYGEVIAKSTASDFNDAIAGEAAALMSAQVEVSGSTHHDGVYKVMGASAAGPGVEIEVDQTLSPLEYDGKLSWTEIFAIASIDTEERIIEVNTDITSWLSVGDSVEIINSRSNGGSFTILSLKEGGTGTLIAVKEPLSEPEIAGKLTYSKEIKTFDIASIDTEERIIEIDTDITSWLNVGDSVEIVNSTSNGGLFTILSIKAGGAGTFIGVKEALSEPDIGGKLTYSKETKTFDVTSIDTEERIIEIDTDITSWLNVGDSVEIVNSTSNGGSYTIMSIKAGGAGTLIAVNEPLSEPEIAGKLTYSKEFDITGITSSSFIIKGGADKQAVSDMISFIKNTFFSKEGLHLIEHVLLRPRINEMLFVEPEEEILHEGLAAQGDLYFQKKLPVVAASTGDRTIKVAGDITGEMAVTTVVHITGSSFNDSQYKVENIAFDGTHTVITTKAESPIAFDLPDAPHTNGGLLYIKKTAISDVVAADNKIIVADTDVLDIQEGWKIQINGSQDALNDRRYLVRAVQENSGNVEVVFGKVEQLVQDALLPVHLDQECESCQQKDPYSFIVSVVLPYWPGRFINMDFRKFLNKTIRQEAPSHVMFNICWISCEHMSEFEEKYKRWLVAIGKDEQGKPQLSKALTEFIDILTRIRNVYPTGTLHNCEEDDTLERAIILNNSVLGTF